MLPWFEFVASIGLEIFFRADDRGRKRPNLGLLIVLPIVIAGEIYIVVSLLPDHPWIALGIVLASIAFGLLVWFARGKPHRRRRWRGNMPTSPGAEA